MSGMRGMAVTLGSLALVCSSLVWAPAGQAWTGGHGAVTCTGNSTSRYDPPLTLRPRPTRIHADVRYTCAVGAYRTVAATSSFDSAPTPASCASVSQGGVGVEIVRYADGGRSLITIESETTRVAGVLVVLQSGRVTAGRGAGHPVRRTVAAPPRQLPTDCLASGLQGGERAVQLEILP
ncbi:hypothetical protein [Streptomyces sp. C36]|uniref:hypothetical protein n=1 Tax=Streptomyces sp. C36 TaxID=3237122 RepID=UPI0034C5C9F7